MQNTIENIKKTYNINISYNSKYNNIIIDIFNNDNTSFVNQNDPIIFNIIGLYYKQKIKDYEQMKKYYLMAIDLGNSDAMFNLGFYYYNIKDYEQMKKYYLMAIDLGNSYAMYVLGLYYNNIKDYEQMKKYYLMAINLGNSDAMFNLGFHYCEIEDYEQMNKYLLMAIDSGNIWAMHKFESYCCNDVILIYYELNKIKNKSEFVIEKLNILRKNKKVCKFINKINYSLNNNLIDDCPICLDTNKNVLLLDCMHFRCIDCYSKYNICKMCD